MNSTIDNTTIDAVSKKLYEIVLPILLLVGIPENILSMYIWARRIKSTVGSTSLFLTAMSIADTLVMLLGCTRKGIEVYSNYTIKIRPLTGCHVALFTFTTISQISTWIIILLCLERSVCIWRPVASRTLCRLRNGSIALGITVALLSALNANFFWTIVVKSDACAVRPEYVWLGKNWNYIDMAVYSFVPLAFILIINSLIIVRLRRSQKLVRKSTLPLVSAPSTTATSGLTQRDLPRVSRPSQREQRSARILRTVTWMAITHFAFTLPITAFYCFENCYIVEDLTYNAICELTETICFLLQMVNHLTHFFIYSFTSSIFRSELNRTLRRKPSCGQVND